MGKKGGSSWLTAVKRAFRSPTKEDEEKVCLFFQIFISGFSLISFLLPSRSRKYWQIVSFFFFFTFSHTGVFVQKREKRRWIFRKPTNPQETVTQQTPATKETEHVSVTNAAAEQKHALAVAVAVATAEAAMATAQAAVQVARLSRPSNHAREHYAAIVIQTGFRGYLVSHTVNTRSGLCFGRLECEGQGKCDI